MGFDVETVKTDLKRLLKQGNQLYLSLAYSTESGAQKEETKKYLEKNGVDVKKFPDFQTEYEVWYSEALQYIKTFIPDRTNDFVALYKNEKRKELTFASYTISDAIIGLCATRAGEVVVNNRAAVPKMRQQVSILESALKLVDRVRSSAVTGQRRMMGRFRFTIGRHRPFCIRVWEYPNKQFCV